MKNKILIIAGPTATGKTQLSIELAKQSNAEIINFDSLLFYQQLNIGTAKPSLEELNSVPHHMINIQSISEPLNAADYYQRTLPIIQEIHSKNRPIILVGGSGFYLQTLLKGMYQSPSTPQEILMKSENIYRDKGITPFREFLYENDIESYQQYHENDHYRIRRAVEHFWANKTKFSSVRAEMQTRNISPPQKYKWNIRYNYIDLNKEDHLEIISKRTNKMITDGLENEVRSLLSQGFTGAEKPLMSIGYKEMQAYLNEEIKSIEDCVERINISTRQLAKSQRTWFKKQEKFEYDILNQYDKVYNDSIEFLRD